MVKDKFSAVWISHSSMMDYLRCPRLYFLRNMYKDPKSGRKITIMQPPLALGQAVHEVVESLSSLPVDRRLEGYSLLVKYETAWTKVTGKLGGFKSKTDEEKYKKRGEEMIKKIMSNPGPIVKKAVKINQDLPHYWFSEEENIILCGKIDWLEHIPESDSIHIIDFKTGKTDEDPESLQLPIYHLLAVNCQKRAVSGASYWYLERSGAPVRVELPSLEMSQKQVLDTARKITLARKLGHFNCLKQGCSHCLPFEAILRGEGEFVGRSDYRQDVYIL